MPVRRHCRTCISLVLAALVARIAGGVDRSAAVRSHTATAWCGSALPVRRSRHLGVHLEGTALAWRASLDRRLSVVAHGVLRVAAALFLIPAESLTAAPMIEPAPASPAEAACRKASSKVLSGWRPHVGEEPAVASDQGGAGFGPSTYGEVTELGARQLWRYMEADGPGAPGPKPICFVDLGSGTGRLVAQAFMELPRARRCVGIELDRSRHAAAAHSWEESKHAARRVREGHHFDSARMHSCATLELLEGDLFELDVSEATHVFVASLCFSPTMMERLAAKLACEVPYSSVRCHL
jgi:hypothetical protein